MRPMAVLMGIIMGSAIAMTVSLTMSAIVFALLPEYSVRLAPERLPLLKGLSGAGAWRRSAAPASSANCGIGAGATAARSCWRRC